MKLPKEKIERVCSTEESRYVINSVLLDIEKKRLLATNGLLAIVIPCEPDEGDTAGLIPPQAFKLARRFRIDHIGAVADWITLAKDHPDGYRITITLPRPAGAFPNIDAIIPQVSGPPAFGVNLHLLSSLIGALPLGDDAAVGIWPGKDLTSAAYVEYRQGYGVIMPMRMDERDLPTMAKRSRDEALLDLSRREQ